MKQGRFTLPVTVAERAEVRRIVTYGCAMVGIPPREVWDGSKRRPVVETRRRALATCQDRIGLGYSQLARVFDMHPSSVRAAILNFRRKDGAK